MLSSLVCEGLSLTVVEVFNYLVSACAVEVWTAPLLVARINSFAASLFVHKLTEKSEGGNHLVDFRDIDLPKGA